MSDITLFGMLPDLVVPEPEPLDIVMRPVDCLLLPTKSEYTNDNNESITSNISDDGSDIIPVDENVKHYLMKDGIFILKKSTNKIFDFANEFHTCDLLESMNEKLKSQVIISLIDWHLWHKHYFSYEVVNKYKRLIDDENRNGKTEFFDSLYFYEFSKLNVIYFFMLKSKNTFQLQVIDKIKFFALIKPIIATKMKISKQNKKNQPHEIIIHEQNN